METHFLPGDVQTSLRRRTISRYINSVTLVYFFIQESAAVETSSVWNENIWNHKSKTIEFFIPEWIICFMYYWYVFVRLNMYLGLSFEQILITTLFFLLFSAPSPHNRWHLLIFWPNWRNCTATFTMDAATDTNVLKSTITTRQIAIIRPVIPTAAMALATARHTLTHKLISAKMRTARAATTNIIVREAPHTTISTAVTCHNIAQRRSDTTVSRAVISRSKKNKPITHTTVDQVVPWSFTTTTNTKITDTSHFKAAMLNTRTMSTSPIQSIQWITATTRNTIHSIWIHISQTYKKNHQNQFKVGIWMGQ